jgi:hypothetical protein
MAAPRLNVSNLKLSKVKQFLRRGAIVQAYTRRIKKPPYKVKALLTKEQHRQIQEATQRSIPSLDAQIAQYKKDKAFKNVVINPHITPLASIFGFSSKETLQANRYLANLQKLSAAKRGTDSREYSRLLFMNEKGQAIAAPIVEGGLTYGAVIDQTINRGFARRLMGNPSRTVLMHTHPAKLSFSEPDLVDLPDAHLVVASSDGSTFYMRNKIPFKGMAFQQNIARQARAEALAEEYVVAQTNISLALLKRPLLAIKMARLSPQEKAWLDSRAPLILMKKRGFIDYREHLTPSALQDDEEKYKPFLQLLQTL